MTIEKTHYAILGDGRLAQHLRHYLDQLELPVSGWARRPESGMNTSPGRDARTRLRSAIEPATHVLLLLSDDAIEPFLRQYPFLHNKTLVHCAGALSLPGVASAHPLMTFDDSRYSLTEYRAIPFIVESGYQFADLLPGLPNPHYHVQPGQKALYHALCVIAGNFPQLLWQTVGRRLQEEINLPPEALGAYLQRSLDNHLSNPGDALTGPLSRGDNKTLARNLQALQNDPLQDLYQAFLRFHVDPDRVLQRQKAS